MRPPICAICDQPCQTETGLIQFSDYTPLPDGVCGHPDGLEWFCEVHDQMAYSLRALTVREALDQLSIPVFSQEGGRRLIDRAKHFAIQAHGDQKYGSNPYAYHLQKVVDVLDRFGFTDPRFIAAAWLHDTLEDTAITIEELTESFGREVSALVDALTDGAGSDRATRKARTYQLIPKILGAEVVKVSDRIANVEESLITQGSHLKRYQAEHDTFSTRLNSGAFPVLWSYLDQLLKN